MIEQFLRELHRPRNTGDPAVKLAVYEIRASSKEQSHRRGYDKVVAEVQPRNFVAACVIKREQHQTEHPTVTRHAAFPDAQDRQRLAQHFRLVKKNVAETPT